jgi:cysteine synthase A
VHYLLVESNTTGTGRLALERLLGRGDRVTFLTRDPERYPFLHACCGSLDVVGVDTNDFGARAAWARDATAALGQVDAVLTFSTFYVAAAAQIAETLGCRSLSRAVALRCHDKYAARIALRDAGVRTPRFWRLDSEREARSCASAVLYPCVMKPRAGSGSRDVRLVHDPGELVDRYRVLTGVRSDERHRPKSGDVLVEELIEGPEFSVETMTVSPGSTSIIGITAKHVSAPPLFVELGHDFPADVPPEVTRAIEETTIAALDAVGYDFGPAHTELRVAADGPIVIEINPRLAGGMIPELIRYAVGVDMIEVVLAASAKRPVSLQASTAQMASIRFITAPRAGRLRSVPSLDEARRTRLVQDVMFDAAAGTAVQPAESAVDRLGYVIAAGPDRSLVTAAADDALRRISLDIQ